MSDDFIPFNQSTPVHGKNRNLSGGFQQDNSFQHRSQNQSWQNNSRHKHRNNWNNSFGSNRSNNSSRNHYNDKNECNIDDYLHFSILKDPWEHLRSKS